jgi:hypothetical protein
MEIAQILCPSCHGAQSAKTSGHYECEFCLAPFTVVDARREEVRKKSQDEGWLQQRIGGSIGGAAVDAASRAFIFRQRLLPDLKRDVDRALEGFTNYRQHALVLPLVPVPPPKTQSRNPLLDQRGTVLGLSDLRARLGNEAVLGFAVASGDFAALQAMERRIADVVHLSNVADAGARRNEVGYAAARRNLEVLIVEIDEAIAGDDSIDQASRGFLSALRARYTVSAEFARICEVACASSNISGMELAGRLERLATDLAESSVCLQEIPYDPAQTMPCVVGMQVETAAIKVFARWLRAYEVITAKALVSFPIFLRDIEALCTGGVSSPEAKADLLEAIADALLTIRGERDAPVIADFEWVDTWAETNRARKTWGLFGNEEAIERTTSFLAPAWIAEVSYSASKGAVFKEGVENKTVALLDACAPDASRVCFLDGAQSALSEVLSHPSRLPRGDIALPKSTASAASVAFAQAAKGRPNMMNSRVHVCGLAWLPAAVAQFTSPKGERSVLSCMNGTVHLAEVVVQQVEVTRQIVRHFG